MQFDHLTRTCVQSLRFHEQEERPKEKEVSLETDQPKEKEVSLETEQPKEEQDNDEFGAPNEEQFEVKVRELLTTLPHC